MAKKLDTKNYIYCQEHDIFFNKERKKKTDKKNEELKKSGSFLEFDACPMCRQDSRLSILSFGTSHA